MTDIESVVADLADLVRRQTGLDDAVFNPGASEVELRQLEGVLEAKLPHDYRRFLSVANGQAGRWLSFPPDQLVILSAGEVEALWQELIEIQDDQFFDVYEDDEKVRSVLYHRGRIPIAYNESANAYLFLDFIPGPKGRHGQIVFNVTEVDCAVIEEDIAALLRRYVEILRDTRARVEQKPPDVGEGYWFTVDGRYFDHNVYRQLRTS